MNHRKNTKIMFSAVAILILTGSAFGAFQDVKPGRDFWFTSTGSAHSFVSEPIPGGFFGPNSAAFDGTVYLKPNPLGTFDGKNVGITDTIVNRLALADLTPGPTAVIPIELVALSLKSVLPITVTFTDATPPQLWNVTVSLNPGQTSSGTMTITHVDDAGGTYSASMDVRPRFTFTKVGGGGGPLMLDPVSPIDVDTSPDVRWDHVPGKPAHQVIAGYTGDASNMTGAPWTNDFYVNTAALHFGPHPLVASPGIPTVSEWGIVVMTFLVLTSATIVLLRRRAVART